MNQNKASEQTATEAANEPGTRRKYEEEVTVDLNNTMTR